jgi:hypothetical protein
MRMRKNAAHITAAHGGIAIEREAGFPTEARLQLPPEFYWPEG